MKILLGILLTAALGATAYVAYTPPATPGKWQHADDDPNQPWYTTGIHEGEKEWQRDEEWQKKKRF